VKIQRDLPSLALRREFRRELVAIEDRDLRREFYRIQDMFAQTIEHDVCTKGGIFYYGDALPPNEEIQARLDAHKDFRPIVLKEGIHPIPATKTTA
jgi:hypothetical protein